MAICRLLRAEADAKKATLTVAFHHLVYKEGPGAASIRRPAFIPLPAAVVAVLPFETELLAKVLDAVAQILHLPLGQAVAAVPVFQFVDLASLAKQGIGLPGGYPALLRGKPDAILDLPDLNVDSGIVTIIVPTIGTVLAIEAKLLAQVLNAVAQVLHFPLRQAVTAIAVFELIDLAGLAEQPLCFAARNPALFGSAADPVLDLPDLMIDAVVVPVILIIAAAIRLGRRRHRNRSRANKYC
jgi:hypothetical protein